MKTVNSLLPRLIVILCLIFIVSNCTKKESNNPFDAECPKELYTPTDLKAEQDGRTIKLSWVQKNTNISGFIINRNENDGTMTELMRIDKSILFWKDSNIVGVTKYEYELIAFAGANLSNIQKASIRTSVFGATVTTLISPTSITYNSIVLGGNVVSDGGAEVIEKGICYGTTQNPTIVNNKTALGIGLGEFIQPITGLIQGTTYYVRSYAINSSGTVYGNQVTFTTKSFEKPIVTTANIDSITTKSAICGGNITNNGGTSITALGVCWSTQKNPTVTNNKTVENLGLGGFISHVSELTQGTTYYIRAYATNIVGIAYGNEIVFKTNYVPVLANLTTSSPISINNTNYVLGGYISSDGYAPVTERGICYSTTQNPTINNNKVAIGVDIGPYSSIISVLTFNTTYYIKAYAINSVGIAYGNQVSFTTLGSVPNVSTKDITNVLETTAIAGGIVLSDEGSGITERGVCFGITNDPTIYDSHIVSGSGPGGFSITLNTLIPNTIYYVRAYGTNKNGTGYGENKTFKTVDAYYAGFEKGLPTGWIGNWSVSSESPYEGYYCLKSSSPNQSIEVTITITNPLGGQISFFHKADGGFFGDILTPFYIDDTLQTTFADEGEWTLKSFSIAPGTHKFKWINNGSTNTFGGGNHFNYIDYFLCPK